MQLFSWQRPPPMAIADEWALLHATSHAQSSADCTLCKVASGSERVETRRTRWHHHAASLVNHPREWLVVGASAVDGERECTVRRLRTKAFGRSFCFFLPPRWLPFSRLRPRSCPSAPLLRLHFPPLPLSVCLRRPSLRERHRPSLRSTPQTTSTNTVSQAKQSKAKQSKAKQSKTKHRRRKANTSGAAKEE